MDAVTLNTPKLAEELQLEATSSKKTPQRADIFFLAVSAKIEEILNRGIETKARMLEKDSENYEEIIKAREQKIKEGLKLNKEEATWKQIQEVGAYVGSSFSIVVGTSLVASGVGTVPGVLMISSGAVSITNSVLNETKTWDYLATFLASDKATQGLISSSFYLGTTAVSSLVGFVGGIGGTLSSLNALNTVLKAAETAKDIAFGITTIGKGTCDYRTNKLESDIKSLKSSEEKNRFEIDSSLNTYKLDTKKAALWLLFYGKYYSYHLFSFNY